MADGTLTPFQLTLCMHMVPLQLLNFLHVMLLLVVSVAAVAKLLEWLKF